MRGQGRIYRTKIGDREVKTWWLDYSVNGKRVRESSHTTVKREAFKVLRQKIGDRESGKVTGNPNKVTLADLRAGLEQHYTLEGNRSWTRAAQAFANLETFFGATAPVLTITKRGVSAYQHNRLEVDEAARNSVRYEVGVLSAAFGVAVEQEVLAAKPDFKQIAEGDKRSGFFEPNDFGVVVASLPAAIADLVRFLYMTGWRRGEGVDLTWAAIEWDDDQFPGEHAEPVPGPDACLRLREADTKGGDDRIFPFAEATELRDLLVARWRQRAGLNVFHRNGKPIGDFRKVWAKACKAAGLEGRLVHDLRRSAARDFRRRGISEGEIMKLCGWKTRDMFDRYNIVDTADLRRAVARRFTNNGTQAAHNPVEAGQAV